MRRISRHLKVLLPAACLALATTMPAASGVQSGTVDTGVRYAMGGVGLGEREELRARRDDYNFWVATATRSGHYLAGVEVQVVEARSGDVMLQGTLNGPWLFADLPPGQYTVRATAPDGESLSRRVQVGRGSAQRTLLSFR
jgi:hypothetical protein